MPKRIVCKYAGHLCFQIHLSVWYFGNMVWHVKKQESVESNNYRCGMCLHLKYYRLCMMDNQEGHNCYKAFNLDEDICVDATLELVSRTYS